MKLFPVPGQANHINHFPRNEEGNCKENTNLSFFTWFENFPNSGTLWEK